jgi:hypothetical protein
MGTRDGERGSVVGIAAKGRRWSCVGEPDMSGTLPMFSCGAEGSYSVLALVPAGMFMETPEGMRDSDPVMVHMTACREHLRAVRKYLQAGAPEPVWTLGTEYLMDHWGQVVEPIELPVFGLAEAV